MSIFLFLDKNGAHKDKASWKVKKITHHFAEADKDVDKVGEASVWKVVCVHFDLIEGRVQASREDVWRGLRQQVVQQRHVLGVVASHVA